MLDLIRDEVNVKEIVFDDTIEGEVQLDVNLTEELKQEGKNNEALRAYNDMRKEGGYIPQMYVVNVSSTMAVFSDPERRKEMKIENFHKISLPLYASAPAHCAIARWLNPISRLSRILCIFQCSRLLS